VSSFVPPHTPAKISLTTDQEAMEPIDQALTPLKE
jgi:hypothetical protein